MLNLFEADDEVRVVNHEPMADQQADSQQWHLAIVRDDFHGPAGHQTSPKCKCTIPALPRYRQQVLRGYRHFAPSQGIAVRDWVILNEDGG